jgi:hypothetical protein
VSLTIDVSEVAAVLLADGWRQVHKGSFVLDSYEFVDGDDVLVGGGQVPGVPSVGFQFLDGEAWPTEVTIAGPLTSILAIRRVRSR